MNITSIDHHIKHLTHEHDMLESKLVSIQKQPSWNEFEVEALKKQKLKVKDELSRMHRQRYDLMQEVDLHDDR